MTNTELASRYWEDGFVVVPGVLSPADVDELREAAESDALREQRTRLGGDDHIVHQVDVTAQHPAFARVASHPAILDWVELVLGPDIQVHHSKLASKPQIPGRGEFAWHQDFPFTPHTNSSLVSAFIYLDDATPQNGCMSMARGSYRLGPLRHVNDDGAFLGYCVEAEQVLAAHGAVTVEAKAGDMSLHHCFTLHSSPANLSGEPRRGLIFEYRASDAVQLGGPTFVDTGRQVRGRFTGAVRCEEGLFELPLFPWTGSPSYGLYSQASPGLHVAGDDGDAAAAG
jgi:ectoine hydroxylase-related dioxygenase (phytanoyl-CoA dioxygenase family)